MRFTSGWGKKKKKKPAAHTCHSSAWQNSSSLLIASRGEVKTNRFILSVLSAAEVFTKPWGRGPGVRGQGKGAQVKVLRNSELKGWCTYMLAPLRWGPQGPRGHAPPPSPGSAAPSSPDEAPTWAERGGRTLLHALSGEFIGVSRAAPGWRKVEGRRRGVQVRIVAARERAGRQVPPYGEVGGKLGRERGSGWVRLGAGAGCSGCPGAPRAAGWAGRWRGPLACGSTWSPALWLQSPPRIHRLNLLICAYSAPRPAPT